MERRRSGDGTRAAARRRSRRAIPSASRTPTARRRAIRSRRAPRESFRLPRGRGTPCRRRAGAECRAPRSRRRTARVTSSPKLTNRRNSTAMCRGCSGTRRSAPSACCSRHVQPLLLGQPRDEGADRVRQRSVDRLGRRLERAEPAAAVRLRHRQRDDAGCESSAARDGDSATYSACTRRLVGGHLRRERGVDEPLNRRHAAIARRQLQHAPAARRELVAHRANRSRRRCRGIGRSPASDRRR